MKLNNQTGFEFQLSGQLLDQLSSQPTSELCSKFYFQIERPIDSQLYLQFEYQINYYLLGLK